MTVKQMLLKGESIVVSCDPAKGGCFDFRETASPWLEVKREATIGPKRPRSLKELDWFSNLLVCR